MCILTISSVTSESAELSDFCYKILGISELCVDDVLEALHSTKTNKGSGPDNIFPFILKKCADSSTFLLLNIFYFSYSGSFSNPRNHPL